MTSPVRIEREDDVAVIVIDNPPVNATSHAVRRALLDAVHAVDADNAITAAVLIGAGRTFVAGADIREFGKPLEVPQMPVVIAAIVDSPRPFVAALHGNALGGGFELALACDARIAAPGTKVGLPEVTLGMIPGAGGTQHVPRLIGVAKAIELVCSGRRIELEEALRMGLVDWTPAFAGVTGAAGVMGEAGVARLRAAAVDHARTLKGRKRRLRDMRVPHEAPQAIEDAARAALASNGDSAQVRAGIAAVRSAATLPYAEALAREREVFQALRASDTAAVLREKFFAERNRPPR